MSIEAYPLKIGIQGFLFLLPKTPISSSEKFQSDIYYYSHVPCQKPRIQNFHFEVVFMSRSFTLSFLQVNKRLEIKEENPNLILRKETTNTTRRFLT